MCLVHEKPFAGVNGSGKHNNWSISDSDGNNLLNPAPPRWTTPSSWSSWPPCCAVYTCNAALRLGTVGAGNDHRLGANEAPPAILSVYLGEQHRRARLPSSTARAQEQEERGHGSGRFHPASCPSISPTAAQPTPSPATSLSSAPWVPRSPWLLSTSPLTRLWPALWTTLPPNSKLPLPLAPS